MAGAGATGSLYSKASRASASASRISPARTRAIARSMQPCASAISQPRGRATSMSASHCASAGSGRIEPLASGRALFEGGFRSVLPTALAHGITTETAAAAALAAIDRDAVRFADRPVLWPLLIGAWKRKDSQPSAESGRGKLVVKA
jgi:hypothetical protein